MKLHSLALIALVAAAAPALAADEKPMIPSETVKSWDAPEANQGVGVDDKHFYAIDNTTIAKYEKETGKRIGL
jgi:hypothetical protein